MMRNCFILKIRSSMLSFKASKMKWKKEQRFHIYETYMTMKYICENNCMINLVSQIFPYKYEIHLLYIPIYTSLSSLDSHYAKVTFIFFFI